MRILLLVTQSEDSPSGGGRYWPLARALAGLGHAVTLVALHHDYQHLERREYLDSGVKIHYVGQMHVRKVGNRKHYYHPLKMMWIALVGTLKLSWIALRAECDVVHICKSQPMNGLAGWLVHLIRRIPVYLDSDDYESVNNRFSSAWQQKIVTWFENWLPSFVSGITVGTTFIREHFIRLGYPADRTILVFNGVDRKRFDFLEGKDLESRVSRLTEQYDLTGKRVVIYVGSISLTSHAIDILLQAFQQVVTKCQNAFLLLVGSGEDLDRLKTLAIDLGLETQTRFIGRIPLQEIPLYLRLGEITVDPMHQSLPAESSLSLKLVESIVAGMPCVTADIGDRREIVRGAGIAVKPDDPGALADGIIRLLEDPLLYASMIEGARNKRQELLWDSRVRDFIAVYESR